MSFNESLKILNLRVGVWRLSEFNFRKKINLKYEISQYFGVSPHLFMFDYRLDKYFAANVFCTV